MQGNTLVKLVIAGVIALVIWKKGIPWWQERQGQQTSKPAVTADDSCVDAGERASEVWGSGLRDFINPPYDMAAWEAFRMRTQDAIALAEQRCTCAESSCSASRQAMGELRALIGEMDGSIRTGSPPPSNAVQRQEAIDNALTTARDLVRQGK